MGTIRFNKDALIKKISSYLQGFDKKEFRKAIKFAEDAHKGQMRKDEKTPYVVHPLSAVDILADLHAPQDILVAGLLHDVPEDTVKTIEDVRKEFGSKVAFLVDSVTKLSKVHYQHDMSTRQVESLKKLFLNSAKVPGAILIKLADRLHNMQTLEHVKPEKRIRIAGETLEIFVPIANLLGIQGLKSNLEDLCFKFLLPSEYKNIQKNLSKSQKKSTKALDTLINTLKESFKKGKLKAEIEEREQNNYTIYKKLSSHGKSIDDLSARNTIRIIVDTVPECYEALGIVHGRFVPKLGKFKDYIANPKMNSYRSLHTMVFGVNGMLAEVQIRTKNMHIEAIYGIASNFFIKDNNGAIGKDVRSKWMKKIVSIEKNETIDGSFLDDLKIDIFEDRIYTFSPKGQSIDLPQNASAIDHAYAVGSNIGNHAHKADINGTEYPVTKSLKNGDVVRIITKKTAKPSLSWLPFVKTNVAKQKIQDYLKKFDTSQKIDEGRKLLQKEFNMAKMGLFKKSNFKKIQQNLQNRFKRDFTTLEDLYVAIGEGIIKVVDVTKLFSKTDGTDIIGGKTVDIKVLATNRFGLLKDISRIVYKYSSDIIFLKAWASRKQDDASFNMRIAVNNLDNLGHIFDELEQLDDVKRVYRVAFSKMILSIVLIVITALVWFFHPLLLEGAMFYNLLPESNGFSDFFPYVGVFALFVMAVLMTRLIKYHFPYARRKGLVWFLVFSIPVLGIGVMFLEAKFLDVKRDWVPIVIELVIIYFYMLKSYWQMKKLY